MPAAEFQAVRPDLLFWQAYEPAVKCDLSCSARLIEGRLYFIDPIPLAAAALAELCTLGEPAAIFLTNGNHARAAAEYRKRLGVPVLAHGEAVPELDLAVDELLEEGRPAPGGFEVLTLPGAPPGEVALAAGGIVQVGDSLIHLEPFGFALLPEKYCRDLCEMRRALGKLLRFNFEILTFAHGLPLVSQARQRLETLLA